MPSPRLRDARPEDLPALLALEAMFPGDRLSARQFRRHLANPRACLRVAADGPRLLGYHLVFLRAGSPWARLYSIAVDPASIRTASVWPLPGMEPEDRFGVRLSTGLEDTADLIADLECGLAAWAAHGDTCE